MREMRLERVARRNILEDIKAAATQARHALRQTGCLMLWNVAAVVDDKIEIAFDAGEHGFNRGAVCLIDLPVANSRIRRPVRLYRQNIGSDDLGAGKAVPQPAYRRTVMDPELDHAACTAESREGAPVGLGISVPIVLVGLSFVFGDRDAVHCFVSASLNRDDRAGLKSSGGGLPCMPERVGNL